MMSQTVFLDMGPDGTDLMHSLTIRSTRAGVGLGGV